MTNDVLTNTTKNTNTYSFTSCANNDTVRYTKVTNHGNANTTYNNKPFILSWYDCPGTKCKYLSYAIHPFVTNDIILNALGESHTSSRHPRVSSIVYSEMYVSRNVPTTNDNIICPDDNVSRNLTGFFSGLRIRSIQKMANELIHVPKRDRNERMMRKGIDFV